MNTPGRLQGGAASTRRRASGVAERMLGAGWMYRMPKRYDGVIVSRCGEVRARAYDDLLARLTTDGRNPGTVVDIACGNCLLAVGTGRST